MTCLSSVNRLYRCVPLCMIAALILSAIVVPHALAQTESVLCRITGQSGVVITGARVEVRNVGTSLSVPTATNSEGLYTVPSLRPGRYVISVHNQGFRSVSLTQFGLNVQHNVVRNFALEVGSVSESITVTAESEKISTTDAAVSPVVDRNFTENLPMNGRSFQSLPKLAPGVVVVAALVPG